MKHLELAHKIWKEHVKPDDVVIDATCGNGHDTLILAKLTPHGHVYAFDIQKQAIEKTKKRLQDFTHITYVEGCHSVLPEVAPSLIIYNLGYLPGGDKNKTTLTKTTLESLESAKQILKPGGLISVTLYPGHAEGLLETQAILSYLETETAVEAGWSYELHQPNTRTTAPKLLVLAKLQRHK